MSDKTEDLPPITDDIPAEELEAEPEHSVLVSTEGDDEDA